MEDKVQEFLKKYEINPYAEDCFAMEEKLLSVPVEEFSDEVLEFLISNEIGHYNRTGSSGFSRKIG